MSLAPVIGTLAGGVIAIIVAIILFAARGGRRAQAVFFLVIGFALLGVGGVLAWQQYEPPTATGSGPLVAAPRGPVQVRVLTALPVEPWVREAARAFNEADITQDGQPVEVQVIAMDGLTALGKFDRDEYGSLGNRTRDELSADELERLQTNFPTVWIPDSRYLVELANAAYKERIGRDVFLTDGEYRARPIAISLFVWGIYQSRRCVDREVRRHQLADHPRCGDRGGRLAGCWAASRAGASSSWSCPIRSGTSAGWRDGRTRASITTVPTSLWRT